MVRRGLKEKRTDRPRQGVEPLRSQNIMVGGHRTSMRLEPSMWDALEEISYREGVSVNKLCTRVKERIDEQARRRGIAPDAVDMSLTSAVRVFIAAYYRQACSEDGHARAGHGGNDPFVGTPFERPAKAVETEWSADSRLSGDGGLAPLHRGHGSDADSFAGA